MIRRHPWLTAIALLLLQVCGVYGFLAWRLYRHENKLSRNYSAELNAPILATPEEKRAWPHYLAAIEQLEGIRSFTIYHPASPEWAKIVEVLQRNQQPLAAIREASELPFLGFLLSDGVPELTYRTEAKLFGRNHWYSAKAETENPNLLVVMLPHLSMLRQLNRMLQADTYLALEQGDNRRVTANFLARLNIARHTQEQRVSICHAVAWSIHSSICDTLYEILNDPRCSLTENDLLQIDVAMITLSFRPVIDRENFYDAVQRLYTDDGCGDGLLLAYNAKALNGGRTDDSWLAKLQAPLQANNLVPRAKMVRAYDELADIAEQDFEAPIWRNQDLRYLNQRNALSSSGTKFSLITWLSAEENIYRIAERAVQQRDAARTVIALRRYKTATGNWPERLDYLIPRFLDRLPIDRMDGQPLRYRFVNGQPLLYSIGTNLEDDNGRPFPDHTVTDDQPLRHTSFPWDWAKPEASDFEPGDWLFSPPPRREFSDRIREQLSYQLDDSEN